jgi:hypothetical protein
MRRIGWLVGVLLAAVLLAGGTARAEAPKVVKATPDDGEKDVDPATKELRVVFDQPMNRGGMSIVGGGDSFPGTGRAHWVDDRTCVMPMQLKPKHAYQLSINSERFQNLKNLKGESAVPYPIRFRTGAGKGGEGVALKEADNRKAVKELRRAIDEEYSHRDLRKVDWPKAIKAATPRLLAAKSPEEFAQRAADLLAPAKDLHLWLTVGDEMVPTFRRDVPPNANVRTLRKLVPGWTAKGRNVAIGKFPDGIAYVLIGSWAREEANDLNAVYEVLDENPKGLIIDVRPNSGGAEPLAQEVAGCFLDRPKAYAKHVIRSGGKFGPPRERVVEPNKGRPRYRGKVAVLMGPKNMSSCESFLLMMKQVPTCTLVGERSFGSSGNPKPFDLGNGVTLFVPSWNDLGPDGKGLEGNGIAPDVEIKATPKDFATRDPVLEAALALVRKP